jgi:protein arginine N-methyltransferase 5
MCYASLDTRQLKFAPHRYPCSTDIQALRAEFAQALYLSIPTFIIPSPSLANRAFLPSYARAIAGLLQMGGQSAYTQLSIRIPISDPDELIQQGPASAPPSAANGGVTPIGPPPPATARSHKRMSSLSTRPQSMHQAQLQAIASLQQQGQGQGGQGANGNLAPNGHRNVSNASAFSQASSVMSARSAVGPQVQGGDPSSTWEMWDTVRAMCGYHPRLSLSELDLMLCSYEV